MKKLIVFLIGMFLSTASYAEVKVPLEFSYDHYFTPNGGNNYDDAWGASVKVKHPILRTLEGAIGLGYITDIDFPSIDDPKGSFGELRGYGLTYDLILGMPINDRIKPFITGGLGYYFWDFRENPFLQDNRVTVEVDNSIAYRIGGGVEFKFNDSWSGSIGAMWFDTNIGVEAKNEVTWNILDSDDIGLQYIQAKASFTYKF